MQLNQRIWRVGQLPERLPEARLASERQLEEMIGQNLRLSPTSG
jgi:hypothetical protein